MNRTASAAPLSRTEHDLFTNQKGPDGKTDGGDGGAEGPPGFAPVNRAPMIVVVQRNNLHAQTLRDWLISQQRAEFSVESQEASKAQLVSRFGDAWRLLLSVATPTNFAPHTAEGVWDLVFNLLPRPGEPDMRLHCLRAIVKMCVGLLVVGRVGLPASEQELDAVLGHGSISSEEGPLLAHSDSTSCDIEESCARLGVEHAGVSGGRLSMGRFQALLDSGGRRTASVVQRMRRMEKQVKCHRVWCLESLAGPEAFDQAVSTAGGEGSSVDKVSLFLAEKPIYGRRACERACEAQMRVLRLLAKSIEFFEVSQYGQGVFDTDLTPEQHASAYSLQRIVARNTNVLQKLADRVSAYADDCFVKVDGEYDLHEPKRPARGASRRRRRRHPGVSELVNPMWTDQNWQDPTVFYNLRDMQPSQQISIVLLRNMQARAMKRRGTLLFEPVRVPLRRVERFVECARCGRGSPWCSCPEGKFEAGRSTTVCARCKMGQHVGTPHAYVPLTCPVAGPDGAGVLQNTYAYTGCGTVQENVAEMCSKDLNRPLWKELTASKTVELAVVDQLSKHHHEELPELIEDLNVWSFANGLFYRLCPLTDRPAFFTYECTCRHRPDPYPGAAGLAAPGHLFRPRVASTGDGWEARVLRCERVKIGRDARRAALSYDLAIESPGSPGPPRRITGWCDGSQHDEGDRVRVYFGGGARCAWYRVEYDQTWSPPKEADVELDVPDFFGLVNRADHAMCPKRHLLESYLLEAGRDISLQAFADEALGEEAFTTEAAPRPTGAPVADRTPAGARRFAEVVQVLAAWERCLVNCWREFDSEPRPRYKHVDLFDGGRRLVSTKPSATVGAAYDDVSLPSHLTSPGAVDGMLNTHRERTRRGASYGCDFRLDTKRFAEEGRVVLLGVPDNMLAERQVRVHTHCIRRFGQEGSALPRLSDVVSRKYVGFTFRPGWWLRSVQGPTLPPPVDLNAKKGLADLHRQRHFRGDPFREEAPPSRHHEPFSVRGTVCCRCCHEAYRPGRTKCPELGGGACQPWIIRDGLFGKGSRDTTPCFNSIFEAQRLVDEGDADADRSAGKPPVPTRSRSTLSVVKCVLGRLMFPAVNPMARRSARLAQRGPEGPVKIRGNWEIAVFQKGMAQTGKSISMETLMELFTPTQRCKLNDNCQDKFTGYSDEALIIEQNEFGSQSNRNDSEFCTTVSNQGYALNQKHKEPMEGDHFPAHQIYCGNSMPPWPDTNGRISRRLFIVPFKYRIAEEDMNLGLKTQIIEQELGYILADICFSFAWYSRAHTRRIWDFCPRVFVRAKEASMTSDSFRAFVRECEDLTVGKGAFIPMRDMKKRYREFCINSGRKTGTWTEDLYSAEASAKGFFKVSTRMAYPPPAAPPKARAEYLAQGHKLINSRITWFSGIGLKEFFPDLVGDKNAPTRNPGNVDGSIEKGTGSMQGDSDDDMGEPPRKKMKPESLIKAMLDEVAGMDTKDARTRLDRMVSQALSTIV